jgi:hypothetical protein
MLIDIISTVKSTGYANCPFTLLDIMIKPLP